MSSDRDLENEIDCILESIEVSPAIYRIERNWSGGIRTQETGSLSVKYKSFIAADIAYRCHEKINIKTMKKELWYSSRADLKNSIRDDMGRFLLSFLNECQNQKNNKLTTLYKWHANFTAERSFLASNCKFENDIFAVYKWLKGNETNKGFTQDVAKNGIGILDILMTRYEQQGMIL